MKRFSAWVTHSGGFVTLALMRGAALFVGGYSLANELASTLGTTTSQDLWWIDLRFLPPVVALCVTVVCALLLLAYGVLPKLSAWRRTLTFAACVLLAGIGLQNTAAFYRLWGAGSFSPGVPVPFSLVITAIFGLLGWGVLALRPARRRLRDDVAAAVALVIVLALFPLAQVAFFGTSDYRAKADAAVVFGARVFDDGSLSPSLRDRVVTAVDLYRSGLVRTLVMSGAVEPNGYDETVVMRSAAEKAGVPSSAIELDPQGVDTDATVRDTTRIFARQNLRRILAVSQGYHLPRVKLAYLAAGWDVRTVPAGELEPIGKTPLFIAREIPAFWAYWLRAFWNEVRGGETGHLL